MAARREEGLKNTKSEYKEYFENEVDRISSLYRNIEINKQILDSLRNSIAQLSLNNYPLYNFNNNLENNNINTNNNETQNEDKYRYGGSKGTRPTIPGSGSFARKKNKREGGTL